MTIEELSLLEEIRDLAWQFGRQHEVCGCIERIAIRILRQNGVPDNDTNPRRKVTK